MDVDQALAQARAFLDEHPISGFASEESLIAAAILWGEQLGLNRMREIALQAMAATRQEILEGIRA